MSTSHHQNLVHTVNPTQMSRFHTHTHTTNNKNQTSKRERETYFLDVSDTRAHISASASAGVIGAAFLLLLVAFVCLFVQYRKIRRRTRQKQQTAEESVFGTENSELQKGDEKVQEKQTSECPIWYMFCTHVYQLFFKTYHQ